MELLNSFVPRFDDLPKIPFYAPSEDGGCTCKEGKACGSPGKHPILKWNEGSIDEKVHAQWAEKYKGCNWGVVIRPSFGVAVIDVDVHKRSDGTVVDGFATLERMGWELPQTVTVNTGRGGKHYYYYAPYRIDANKVLGEGVELKVQATLVTPPSRHANGRFYVFDANGLPESARFAELPQWVYDELDIKLEKPKTVQAATTPKIEIKTARVKQGQRHNHMVGRARRLRWRGMEKEELEKELLRINKEECDPPLPEKEVLQIAAYYAKKPSRKQITDGALIELTHKDGGHAAVMYELFRDTYCFSEPKGKWMLWTGVRWQPVNEAIVRKNLEDGVRYYYEGLLEEVVSRYDQKVLEAKIVETYSVAKMMAALEHLKGWHGIIVGGGMWDKNIWLYNMINCTLDFETGTVRENSPWDYITKLAPVIYDPQATAPKWQQHLELFLPNPNVRRQVMRDLAGGLVGERFYERLSIWLGRGANGKTTTAKVIQNIMGDYVDEAPYNFLVQSNYDRHPTEIADLDGLRLVFVTEIDKGKKLSEALAKKLTGNDRLKARFMRQDFYRFEPTHSLILITNYLPAIEGDDDGIWRRVLVTSWDYRIPKDKERWAYEVIKELSEEGSGITNTIITALNDILADRTWVPEEVEATSEEYRIESDKLYKFIKDRCKLCPQCKIPKSVLYNAYLDWCKENDQIPITHKEFTARLRQKGIKDHKGPKGVRYYIGIDLK